MKLNAELSCRVLNGAVLKHSDKICISVFFIVDATFCFLILRISQFKVFIFLVNANNGKD